MCFFPFISCIFYRLVFLSGHVIHVFFSSHGNTFVVFIMNPDYFYDNHIVELTKYKNLLSDRQIKERFKSAAPS